MKQLQQISAHECELRMRLLLCQDAIFHRIQISSDIGMQKAPSHYAGENWLVSSRQKMTCG